MLSDMTKKDKTRRNEESGLKQTSVWLRESDIETLKEIGKRPDVDREWSWLARKAMQEYIERYHAAQLKVSQGSASSEGNTSKQR
jgi:hypothetical protein